MEIIAMITARIGSKRVKMGNSRLIDIVYVNTESDTIGKIAIDSGVKYYKRDSKLTEDTSTSNEDVFNI